MPSPRNRTCIRQLNDDFRSAGPGKADQHRWVMTRGVQQLGEEFVEQAIVAVRSFEAFDRDNDPHGEHDFGSFDLAGERVLWKVDYYDRSLTGGSPDPADEAVTCRVLTIMLAFEY